jgi:hypothetical protein
VQGAVCCCCSWCCCRCQQHYSTLRRAPNLLLLLPTAHHLALLRDLKLPNSLSSSHCPATELLLPPAMSYGLCSSLCCRCCCCPIVPLGMG